MKETYDCFLFPIFLGILVLETNAFVKYMNHSIHDLMETGTLLSVGLQALYFLFFLFYFWAGLYL